MFILCQLLVASTAFPVAETSTATAQIQSETFVADGVFHAEIEGPAVDASGHLYAVNFGGRDDSHKGTIGKVTPKGEASLYLKLPPGSVGNGIRFDSKGQMFIADYTGHNIWRYDGKTLHLHSHQPLMHQPNDLAMTHTGVLFASDPNWKKGSGQLWKIQPDGSTELVETNMGTTNGVEVSQDQRFLYVNESAQRRIWVYQLDKAYRPTQKKLLIEFPDFGLDGMRTDSAGNLYVARYGKGVIAKISPKGEQLAEIALNGKFPTNVTFDPTGQWLYVTMQQRGAIERIQLTPSLLNP